ncbi:hypothetical protein NUSPORA_00930 [Nucleospora cyclopteri]
MKIFFNGGNDEFLEENPMFIPIELISQNNLITVEDLLKYIYLKEPRARESFYNNEGKLANGTICLIDDIDREIVEETVDLKKINKIVLLSTLHGG